MKPIEREAKTQFKTSLFASFLIFILLGTFATSAYYSIITIRQNKLDNEWNYILSVLYENEDKAKTQADNIKDDIVEDTTLSYNNNKSGLTYDMNNLNVNSPLSKILDNNCRGKFINVDNDNNDIFIIATWVKNNNFDLQGEIIYDKSINCMSNGEMRTLDKELSQHYNYELGYNNLKRILLQDKEKPIIWEYLPSTDPDHIMIKNGTLSELKEVFIKEGLQGLKTYEILVQSNIMDNGDLLGNTKVQSNGIYNSENKQMIIVQGFSLYDALMSNKHDTRFLEMDKQYASDLRATIIISISLLILILVIFATLIKLFNQSADMEDRIIEILKMNKP